MRPLTDSLPKPLAPVNGVPFLDYLIHSLECVGIRRILLLLGYKAAMFIDRYGRQQTGTVVIDFSFGAVEDQTGRRLLNAYDQLEETFLLLYGDNYWPIEMDQMLSLYQGNQATIMMTVFGNTHGTGEYGPANNVLVGTDALVKVYDNTRSHTDLNGVNIGYILMEKSLIDTTITKNLSFEDAFLGNAIVANQVLAYVTGAQYYSITDMDSLQRFARIVDEEGITPLQWPDRS